VLDGTDFGERIASGPAKKGFLATAGTTGFVMANCCVLGMTWFGEANLKFGHYKGKGADTSQSYKEERQSTPAGCKPALARRHRLTE
jgi:hypothetical protein